MIGKLVLRDNFFVSSCILNSHPLETLDVAMKSLLPAATIIKCVGWMGHTLAVQL